jgi:SNF2 family DNA or RNA helicase
VIAFICSLVQDNAPGPFLVIAPLSTLTNWCTEFARFAPNVSLQMSDLPIDFLHSTFRSPVWFIMVTKKN